MPIFIPPYVLPSQPYDLFAFYPGVPLASAVLLYVKMVRSVVLPINLTGSLAGALTAATASTTLNIQKNGTTIGTIIFAAAGTVGTFTFTTAITFVAGDVLSVIAPSVPDSTLALLNLTLTGTR